MMKQITVGKRQFELHWFNGKVLSATKNLETRVHGGGGEWQGNAYSSTPVTSTTTVHDQLFLAGRNGTERAFQLQNFNIACRESHQVTVAWATKTGNDTGQYVLVYNQTTQDICFKDSNISTLVAPSKLGCSGIVLVALVIPFLLFIGGWFVSFVVGVANTANALDREPSVLSLVIPLVVTLIAIIAFFAAIFVPVIWFMKTTNKRVREFKAAINVLELASA